MSSVMRGVLSHFACGEQRSILLKSQADRILARDTTPLQSPVRQYPRKSNPLEQTAPGQVAAVRLEVPSRIRLDRESNPSTGKMRPRFRRQSLPPTLAPIPGLLSE
jgi:hypothetical protein